LKPARFRYIAPISAGDAVRYLADYDGDARCLSGGQSLVPLMNFRLLQPAALIDLNQCPGLDYMRREGNFLVVGTMTRQAALEHSSLVAQCCPLITAAIVYLASPAIRNRGTTGGTLAHADRTAELPAVAVALGAEIVALSPKGERTIAAADFFLGDLTTALQPDEMLREVRFPVSSALSRVAFTEAGNRHHDLALVGVAVNLSMEDENIGGARIVCHGAGPQPVRLTAVEDALTGQRPSTDLLEHAVRRCGDTIEPEGDNHASAAYRAAVLPRLVLKALRQAGNGAFTQ
jgi:CO/xanthine dehydrogenase FAD-binding subunit